MLAFLVCLGVLSATGATDVSPVSFGALLLARSARLRRGARLNFTADAGAIERALSGTGADESLDAIDAIEDMIGKPPGLMDQINQMRCEVCWNRADVLGHKKCVKFFAKVCKKHHRGESEVCKARCPKFLALLQKECWNPNPKHRPAQQWCDLYEEITGIKCPKPEASPAPAPANPDMDGDGHKNEEDAFPEDPKEWADEDGDGIGDNADPDRDGDGHSNDKDDFPDDKIEWKDSDGDGIGDNADTDRDGDGHENDADKYPDDPTRWADPTAPPPAAPPAAAPPAGPPGDRDADGCPDAADAFPDDPSECLDSDGDGFGDNKDPWPHNPNCYHPSEPCPEEAEKKKPTEAQKQMIDPSTLNKIEQGLPSQGYDEHSKGLVEHDDGDTFSADWGKEWPSWNRESEHQSIKRICEEHPGNTFCKSRQRMKDFTR